jgi:hypothetical protein
VRYVSTTSTAVGPFAMEPMWLIAFTEDGTKIKAVSDLVMSKDVSEFLDRVKGWQEEVKGQSHRKHWGRETVEPL